MWLGSHSGFAYVHGIHWDTINYKKNKKIVAHAFMSGTESVYVREIEQM